MGGKTSKIMTIDEAKLIEEGRVFGFKINSKDLQTPQGVTNIIAELEKDKKKTDSDMELFKLKRPRNLLHTPLKKNLLEYKQKLQFNTTTPPGILKKSDSLRGPEDAGRKRSKKKSKQRRSRSPRYKKRK